MIADADILKCVKSATTPLHAFEVLFDLRRGVDGANSIRPLTPQQIQSDVTEAREWLSQQIPDEHLTGVYLGIDTLNEDHGAGSNIEIGWTEVADPADLCIDWAFELTEYGHSHLIRGLHELHAQYVNTDKSVPFEGQQELDYLFFVGYGGVVLQEAIQHLYAYRSTLYTWGFHDGDIAILCRGSDLGLERIAIWA